MMHHPIGFTSIGGVGANSGVGPEILGKIEICGEFSRFWSMRGRKSLHVHDKPATLKQHMSALLV
jgi:hypothetical protein